MLLCVVTLAQKPVVDIEQSRHPNLNIRCTTPCRGSQRSGGQSSKRQQRRLGRPRREGKAALSPGQPRAKKPLLQPPTLQPKRKSKSVPMRACLGVEGKGLEFGPWGVTVRRANLGLRSPFWQGSRLRRLRYSGCDEAPAAALPFSRAAGLRRCHSPPTRGRHGSWS
jgi:hypothetical protein